MPRREQHDCQTVWCELVHQTDLAILINIEQDTEYSDRLNVWVPKSVIGEDSYDQQQELKGLEEASNSGELWGLSIREWWLEEQDWD